MAQQQPNSVQQQSSQLEIGKLISLVVPPSSSLLKNTAQSDTTLENTRKNAFSAIQSGDYSQITATNPVVGSLLKTLSNSGLSKEGQIKIVDMVFKDAAALSDPFSSDSLKKNSDNNIMKGVNPNTLSTEGALKLAADIATAIVAESAENERKEQQRMQEIQSKYGSIPGSVKAAVMAEYDVAHMTTDQIMAAVRREMEAQNKNRFGDSKPAATHQDTATT